MLISNFGSTVASILGRTAQFALLLGVAALIAAPSALAEEPPVPEEAKEAPAAVDPAAVDHAFPWELDYHKAVARAKAEGKDLVVNFTGSDWCGWCIKLEKEVFTQGNFAEDATKKFVFVFMDFPRDAELKAKVIDPKVNDELRDKYKVRGFPTILLMDAEGSVYGHTGYQKGGPDAYLTHLTTLQDNGKKILALPGQKDSIDAPTLKAGIEALEANRMLDKPAFAWVIDKARTIDPDGTHGVKIYADKIDEKEAFKKLLPSQNGDKPDWPKIYAFIKSAKHMDEDGMFINASVGVVQEHLVEEGKFDEAVALTKRLQGLKTLANNEGAQKYLKDVLAKIEEARKVAADDEEDDAAPAPEAPTTGDSK